MSLYTYKLIDVVKIVDGDTLDLVLDVGFHQRMASRFRLADYDAPELFYHEASEYEKNKAREAIATVEGWLDGYAGQVLVRTEKADSFGRWLADLYVGDDHLGAWLAEHDLATEWPTRWREEFDADVR